MERAYKFFLDPPSKRRAVTDFSPALPRIAERVVEFFQAPPSLEAPGALAHSSASSFEDAESRRNLPRPSLEAPSALVHYSTGSLECAERIVSILQEPSLAMSSPPAQSSSILPRNLEPVDQFPQCPPSKR